MKKKTVVIVSVSLVLAILAIAVISTFPTYLFEVTKEPVSTDSIIQSGNINEFKDDTIDIGSSDGIDSVLPDIDNPDTEPPLSPNTSYNTVAEKDGAKLLVENGAFEKETVFNINKLGIFNKTYYRIRHYIKDFANKYVMYEITAKNGGKNASPIADAKVVIDIPNNYDLEKTEIYFLISDNQVTKLDCTIDKAAKTAIVSFSESGVYIIVEKRNNEDKDVSSEHTENSSSTLSSSESQNSSNNSSDNSSDNTTSSDTDSDQTQSNTSSSTDSDNTGSNDESDTPVSSNPEDWETMDGWVPWY